MDWNAKEADSGCAGFVTRFEVNDSFAARYPVQEVGGRACRELWVPAEELEEFNQHIVGFIEVVESIYGSGFAGAIDVNSNLPTSITSPVRPPA